MCCKCNKYTITVGTIQGYQHLQKTSVQIIIVNQHSLLSHSVIKLERREINFTNELSIFTTDMMYEKYATTLATKMPRKVFSVHFLFICNRKQKTNITTTNDDETIHLHMAETCAS